MVLRQLRTDSGDEHSRHVMDSVRQAKLAVQMDILDGRSWCECSQKISGKLLEQWFATVAAHQNHLEPIYWVWLQYVWSHGILCFEETQKIFWWTTILGTMDLFIQERRLIFPYKQGRAFVQSVVVSPLCPCLPLYPSGILGILVSLVSSMVCFRRGAFHIDFWG